MIRAISSDYIFWAFLLFFFKALKSSRFFDSLKIVMYCFVLLINYSRQLFYTLPLLSLRSWLLSLYSFLLTFLLLLLFPLCFLDFLELFWPHVSDMLASDLSKILTFYKKKLLFLLFCIIVLEFKVLEWTGAVIKGSIWTECINWLSSWAFGT